MKTSLIVLLSSALVTCLAVSVRGQSGGNGGHSADTTIFSHPVRSADIIGKKIEDFQGRRLGTVKDLAVDLNNGRVVEVIVAQGNFWGGDKRVEAVPPDVLTPTGGGRIVYSGLNKKELALAPTIDLSQWNDAVAQPQVEAVYQYFGETPYFLVQEHAPKDANQPMTHPLGAVKRASELIGQTTVNYIDERLGRVEDLVVDLSDARLVEVVISTGSYLGMSDELSAVPPQALRVNADRILTLDVTKDRLSNAPHFPETAWPEFDRAQIVSVYQAYHVLPYLLPVGLDSVASGTPPTVKSQEQSDMDITSKISKDLLEAEGLSAPAHDIKIVTIDGRVTLRGTVTSQVEKLRVGEIASRTVPASQIDNQLVIKETVVSASN